MDIAKLEDVCQTAAQAINSTGKVREVVVAAEVDGPHHLQSVARVEVRSRGRLARQRDLRVEGIVKDQPSAFMLECSELVVQQEFDRIKAADWRVPRANCPGRYAKAFREANVILERRRKR